VTLLMGPMARAVAGALVVVLFSATSYAGARIAMGALEERYRVGVELGDLGQGVVAGTDVKMRGVRVGSVGDIALTDEYTAVAELVLDGGARIPTRSSFLVTGKTLLGEKQIEVLFDGPVEEGPYLPDGALVSDPSRVVEVGDVVASLAEITAAIDPEDLAILFEDLFGAFDGMGPRIAESIDEGARATRVLRRTLPDQLRSTRALSNVAEAIGPTGAEFNRLARNVVEGMPTLSQNQEGIRRLLEAVEAFSRELDATFSVNRPDIDKMIVEGDNVLRLLFHYRLQVGQVVEGVVAYTSAFGEGFRTPGMEGHAGYFQIILEGEDLEAAICHGLPPELTDHLSPCEPSAASSGEPTRALLPRDPLRPQLPAPVAPGLDALLQRALTLGGERG
jgi:phospholipid/cholesterol/gamma-HCH transport system substrate-binding protein